VIRELSCVFVAWFVVFLLLLVRAVSQGEREYQRSDLSANLWMLALAAIPPAFVVPRSRGSTRGCGPSSRSLQAAGHSSLPSTRGLDR
jgi:fumarate reductase subunit C